MFLRTHMSTHAPNESIERLTIAMASLFAENFTTRQDKASWDKKNVRTKTSGK